MQMSEVEFNPDARWHVLRIGREQTRVLLMDNVFTHMGPVRELAQQQCFEPELATYYPGVRAPCPQVLRDAILRVSSGVMAQAYGLSASVQFEDKGSWLSLAARPPEQLHPLQCMPHFDSLQSHDFALMLYASERPFQGTAFYRHRQTGFENITQSRWPEFQAARQAYEDKHGPRPQGYFAGSNDEFEQLGKIDYRPNRLVVYPGSLLHSGLIDAASDLSAQVQNGRLTVNLFVSAR